jgi:allophanate hydrolase subunit 1
MIEKLSRTNFEDENFRATEQLLIRREEEISAEVERRLQKMEKEMKKQSEKRLYEEVKVRERVFTKVLLSVLHPIQKEAIQRLVTLRDEIRTEIEHDQSQFVLNGSNLKMVMYFI